MIVRINSEETTIPLSFEREDHEVWLKRWCLPERGSDTGTEVWSCTFENVAAAQRMCEFAETSPEDWLEWCRVAETFGHLALTSRLDSEMAREDERRSNELERARLEEEAAKEEAAEAERLAKIIECYAWDTKNGWYKINLVRGDSDEPFFTVSFQEKWERDRFRDWFWNQSGRYHEFAARLVEIGDAALERELLLEMIQTERRVKKAGLAVGGRRPLRFWRGDEA